MSDYVTISELRQYLVQVPAGPEADAVLQVILDRAESLIRRQLTGITIVAPAPEDLKQIELELASSLWLTKGTAARLATAGVEGEGGFDYVGGLTPDQKKALRQLRIELAAIAF